METRSPASFPVLIDTGSPPSANKPLPTRLPARASPAYTRGVREISPRSRESALWHDFAALRRYAWLPVATLVVAVAAALAIGALSSPSGDARFRENVVVDALPPLFGPPVLPSPFDYARLATGDDVLAAVSRDTNVPADQIRARVHATASLTSPEIDFRVTGDNALTVARSWQRAFNAAVAQQTPAIERLLVADYARQLDQARTLLEQRSADALASPDDPAVKQQLAAAEANYETASRLAQSYDVVASTMKATPFASAAPHQQSAGVGSTAGRVGAAIAIGLLLGVLGALALDALARRREVEAPPAELPAPFRRGERTTTR
jgi:hypothetical protein